MKIPAQLRPLIEDGVIDEMLYPLMSGKEASVYVVRCGRDTRCAKVYKEAYKRSFKKAVQYREGRKTRNSRRGRAMEKRSKFGRQEQEKAWQNAEVDALYRLAEAGVRVPKPYGCFDGVLLMDLVADDEGEVAPRLADVTMSAEQALEDHAQVMRDVMRMLCAGLIHGDLSEFNVLVDDYGPVIIDLPQAVDAAANNNAQAMFTRDVNKMTRYYAQFAPQLKQSNYAGEIWALYEAGELEPDLKLSGDFEEDTQSANVDDIMLSIKAAWEEEEERRQRQYDADNPDDT